MLRRLASGNEADVFVLDHQRVLKLWRARSSTVRAEREAEVTEAVRKVGAPAPRVLDLTHHDGRPGIVFDRLDGPDLHDALRQRPWELSRIAGELVRAQGLVAAVPAPPQLPGISELIEDAIARVEPDVRTIARQLLDSVRGESSSLCHGNLHLGNVVRHQSELMVIDWGDAAAGPPDAETAMTIVRYHVAVARAGDPWLIRASQAPARWLLLRAYRRITGELTPQARAWIGIRAAERLAEGNPRERLALRQLASRAAAERPGS